MSRAEKWFVEFINKNMLYISCAAVILFMLWARFAGRNYVPADCPMMLYDIPANCNSFFYRVLTAWIVENVESIVFAVRLLGYAGDLGILLLSIVLVGKEWVLQKDYRFFLMLTAIMMSPVLMANSVGGMRIDSLCICFVLLSHILRKRSNLVASTFMVLAAAIIYPAYWLFVLIHCASLAKECLGDSSKKKVKNVCCLIMCAVAVLSAFLEPAYGEAGYFLGKFLVVDFRTGEYFKNVWAWITAMFRLYAPAASTLLLIASFERSEFRIPALFLQVAAVMYLGWSYTCVTAL